MPAQTVPDNYLSFTVDLNTGVASRGLWLCIAQLPPRSKQEIESDATCPQNVEVLSEILATAAGQQRPLLQQHAQPGQLPVLLCPEYAFGSTDWARIDELVDAFPGQLLLVAGFGQSPLEGLETVRSSAFSRGVTLRHGWREEPDPSGRGMNFGCVWVKKPGHSREAFLFGKNFLEAQIEDLNGVFQFNQLTEIVFNDLRLFPFICADALETPTPGAGATVTQRLAGRIVSQHTPALCVGSLMQPYKQASEKWIVAINRLIQEFGESHVALIISNVASAEYDVRKGGSEWRNLSGVYVSKRMKEKGQKQAQESTGYFESTNLMAWPLRSTLPQLAFGTVSLPPYATDSSKLHPWNASPQPRRTVYCDEAPRVRDYLRSGLQDELLLLSAVTECAIGDASLKFQHVSDYVQSHQHDDANALISRLLDGPLLPNPKSWSAKNLCEKCLASLGQCLSYLDALMEGSGNTTSVEEKFSWVPASSNSGEVVRLGTRPVPVALWCAFNSTTDQMLAELRRRAGTRTGTVLRVFGKGLDGDIDPDLWKSICIETTTATAPSVAPGETGHEYADLPTDGAVPVEVMIKPSGFQPLIRLVRTRCEKTSTEFMKGYGDVVRSVQS